MKTSRKILLTVPFLSAVTFAGIAGAQQGQQQQQPQQPQAPVVGAQPVGVTIEEMAIVAKGWSVKKQLMGKAVFNDKNEKIGSIEDVILSPDKTASFAILSTGSFVSLDRHDVAIPFAQLNMTSNRIVLPNATKDALKALPPFQYAR